MIFIFTLCVEYCMRFEQMIWEKQLFSLRFRKQICINGHQLRLPSDIVLSGICVCVCRPTVPGAGLQNATSPQKYARFGEARGLRLW